MHLKNICTIEDANAFLPDFIERFNARFAVQAADPESAFNPLLEDKRIDEIITFRDERMASKGSTISFRRKTYQLIDVKEQAMSLVPRAKVTILTHLDGTISAKYQDKGYSLKEFIHKPAPVAKPEAKRKREPAPVAADHPWRKISPIASRHKDSVEEYFEAKRNRFRKFVL